MIGTVGFLLYDTKPFKPDRPNQVTLFQLLRKEFPTKFSFLKIERKEPSAATFDQDKAFEEFTKAAIQK
ncbi:hypothetical protein DSO57_1024783 [Entomophthora muscae]|uniref:Uncharacterized protein n=1 Tax=Entomophthora muscae TaxID=34485 RepID=A0ACC2SF35_9FUNG|nr:hypothetical protein DSO57_1024783 [Entomophthora muscae]